MRATLPYNALGRTQVSLRRFLIILIILLLLMLWRPSAVWMRSKAIWAKRDRFLRVTVLVLAIYLLYGIYQLYRLGGIPGVPWLSW